jgi:hypothetical protein
MERSACLRREEAVAPTVPGKVNGLLMKGRLVEGDIKIKPRRTGKRGFRKKKIAAACAAADAKVASFDGKLTQRRRDRVRRDRFFVRRKARFFAAGCVNHLANTGSAKKCCANSCAKPAPGAIHRNRGRNRLVVADETKKLAQFAASLYYEDIPEPVIAVTKACLTDTVAVCLLGSNLPWSKSVENFAARSETDSNLYQAARHIRRQGARHLEQDVAVY